jgi:hypothetical protein
MMRKHFLLSLAIVLPLIPAVVYAAAPKLIAQHDKWGSYVIDEAGGKICYMAGKPDTQDGAKGKSRGDVYALITHRPAEHSRNVFSYVAGYGYKPGSDVSLSIDGKNFTLFTKDDTAWAKSAGDDKLITETLRKGTKMVIKGASSRGTKTTDSFSLKGSGSAYQEISRECPGQ